MVRGDERHPTVSSRRLSNSHEYPVVPNRRWKLGGFPRGAEPSHARDHSGCAAGVLVKNETSGALYPRILTGPFRENRNTVSAGTSMSFLPVVAATPVP